MKIHERDCEKFEKALREIYNLVQVRSCICGQDVFAIVDSVLQFGKPCSPGGTTEIEKISG